MSFNKNNSLEGYIRAEPFATKYHVDFNRTIRPGPHVDELLALLRRANTYDMIVLHINSPGGDLATTLQIVSAIKETNAIVVGSAEGNVYSGAALVFLSCHQLQISSFCDFLFHTASGGQVGKILEMKEGIVHMEEQVGKAYHDILDQFFPEDEVEDILNGQERFILAEEMMGIVDSAMANVNPGFDVEVSVDLQHPGMKEFSKRLKAFSKGKEGLKVNNSLDGTQKARVITSEGLMLDSLPKTIKYLKGYFKEDFS